MNKILFLTIFLINLQILAFEDYAVSLNRSTDLIDSSGYIVKSLRKGSVVKVAPHQKDKKALIVEFDGGLYFSTKRNFRVIKSILDEEMLLLKEIGLLNESINPLVLELKEKNISLDKKKSRYQRAQRWVDVQRDMAFSVDYFLSKTKKTRALTKKLERNISLTKIENEMLQEDLAAKKLKLKEQSELLEKLQKKIKPLKAEKSLFDRGFMTIEVVAQNAPLFLNGEIVRYLNKNTELKVGVDHDSNDWYVLTQGKNKYYIASSNVRLKF
jgi:hypothetical protein